MTPEALLDALSAAARGGDPDATAFLPMFTSWLAARASGDAYEGPTVALCLNRPVSNDATRPGDTLKHAESQNRRSFDPIQRPVSV